MVAVAASFLKEVGLAPEQVNILVNDRKLIGAEIERLGVPARFAKTCCAWLTGAISCRQRIGKPMPSRSA